MTAASETKTKRWDALMVVVALASLVPMAWVEARELSWPDPTFRTLAAIDLAFVAFFALEFVAGLARAEDRRKYLRENWFDLLGLVPLYVESIAWLRAARILRITRVLRAFRAVAYAGRIYRESRLGIPIAIATGIVLSIATAFFFVEYGRNPMVQSFGDAVWWALTTTATVGYGDVVPRTPTGRVLAGVLMVTGVGLFGVIASTLSAAIARISGPPRDDDACTRALLRQHRDLVARHARGEITDEELERGTEDLLAIRRK